MATSDNLTDFLLSIADSIRTKKGTTDKINPQAFVSEILQLDKINNQDKEITVGSSGTQTVTFDSGYTGLNSVTVNTQIPEVPTNIIENKLNGQTLQYQFDTSNTYEYTVNGEIKYSGLFLLQGQTPVLTVGEVTSLPLYSKVENQTDGNICESVTAENNVLTISVGAQNSAYNFFVVAIETDSGIDFDCFKVEGISE